MTKIQDKHKLSPAVPYSILDAFTIPVIFKRFYFTHKDREFNLLDIGCACHAPSKTLKYFRYCHYYGVDKTIVDNDEADLKLMTTFFQIDLESEPLDAIPDDFFDVILFSHVIEHLHNGLDVLIGLPRKLRSGGLVYLEYPGLRSLSTPSAKKHGALHFHDDPTHVRMYAMHEIVNVLLAGGLKIIKAGTRRDKMRLLLAPALMVRGILRGDIWSGGLTDLFGFAEYVFARKP